MHSIHLMIWHSWRLATWIQQVLCFESYGHTRNLDKTLNLDRSGDHGWVNLRFCSQLLNRVFPKIDLLTRHFHSYFHYIVIQVKASTLYICTCPVESTKAVDSRCLNIFLPWIFLHKTFMQCIFHLVGWKGEFHLAELGEASVRVHRTTAADSCSLRIWLIMGQNQVK